MNIFEKITAVIALIAFAAYSVLVVALLCGAREAWRHRRHEAAMRRSRGNPLHDYRISQRESA